MRASWNKIPYWMVYWFHTLSVWRLTNYHINQLISIFREAVVHPRIARLSLNCYIKLFKDFYLQYIANCMGQSIWYYSPFRIYSSKLTDSGKKCTYDEISCMYNLINVKMSGYGSSLHTINKTYCKSLQYVLWNYFLEWKLTQWYHENFIAQWK